MKIYSTTSLLTDIFIKLSLGLIFFNYGYGKMESLISGDHQRLVNMVSTIPVFQYYPLFFSWCAALSETIIIFALIYGIFISLPYSTLITKIAGVLSFILSFVICYQHIFVWGDNIFQYGPFTFLNVEDGKKSIFGQFLLIPLSMYVIFNAKAIYHMPSENK